MNSGFTIVIDFQKKIFWPKADRLIAKKNIESLRWPITICNLQIKHLKNVMKTKKQIVIVLISLRAIFWKRFVEQICSQRKILKFIIIFGLDSSTY